MGPRQSAQARKTPHKGKHRGSRLGVIETEIASASALKRLNLYQEQTDLNAELEAMESVDDGSALRANFVATAARYAKAKGIEPAAFRQMGIDRATLKEAKVR